jgi:hypothetical protein
VNFEKASGLKLNQGKSAIIPFGSSVSQLKPDNIPCKWLSSADHERFLCINVFSTFSQDQPRNDMMTKLVKAIHLWIPNHLTVFGRVCAARPYIASKSWYLASVIRHKPKLLSRINALL